MTHVFNMTVKQLLMVLVNFRSDDSTPQGFHGPITFYRFISSVKEYIPICEILNAIYCQLNVIEVELHFVLKCPLQLMYMLHQEKFYFIVYLLNL